MEATLKIISKTPIEISGLTASSFNLNKDFKSTNEVGKEWQELKPSMTNFSITMSGFVGLGKSDEILRENSLASNPSKYEVSLDSTKIAGEFYITNYQVSHGVDALPKVQITLESNGNILVKSQVN